MKHAILKTSFVAITIGLFGFAQASFANNNKSHNNASHVKKVWVCETNASSSDNNSDKKADEMMKKGKAGAVAFAFALKHCRDCTKITCSLEDNSNANNNNNNATTNNAAPNANTSNTNQ